MFKFILNLLFAHLGLSRVHVKKGDLDAALAQCEKALSKDKDHPRALEELAHIHELAGNHDAARSARERIADQG